MPFKGIQQINIRRYARGLLILFVLSWMNLSFQLPAHAAMMQSPVTDHEMMAHTAMIMEDCDCPPALCDAVLATDDRGSESIVQGLDQPAASSSALFATYNDSAEQQQSLSIFSRSDLFALQTGFPPLLQAIILLI